MIDANDWTLLNASTDAEGSHASLSVRGSTVRLELYAWAHGAWHVFVGDAQTHGGEAGDADAAKAACARIARAMGAL